MICRSSDHSSTFHLFLRSLGPQPLAPSQNALSRIGHIFDHARIADEMAIPVAHHLLEDVDRLTALDTLPALRIDLGLEFCRFLTISLARWATSLPKHYGSVGLRVCGLLRGPLSDRANESSSADGHMRARWQCRRVFSNCHPPRA